MSSKGKIYTVHAYKWGVRGQHSYIVGVYTKKDAALKTAESEEQYRGGKYECEVIEWEAADKPNLSGDDMPSKTIKAI